MRIPVGAALAAALAGTPAWSQVQTDSLDKYLTDVAAGMVAAGNLIGLDDSAIQEVQTSQDLIVAFKPFSSGSSKRAFGLAITPARTTITPMSAHEYRNKWYMRILGATTLSYAESAATVSSIAYSKYAFSVDTSYYWKRENDPIVIAQDAFGNCEAGLSIERQINSAHMAKVSAQRELKAAQDEAKRATTAEEKNKAEAKADAAKKAIAAADRTINNAPKDAEAAVKNCIDTDLAKAKWNATRFSLGFAAANIKPEESAAGSTESLGRVVTVGAVVGVGEQGAVYVSLRHTRKEVDLTTLQGTPEYKNNSLVAVRFTWGSKDANADLKLLAEVSNADKEEVTESNRVFMYAVGVDKRLGKGTWLQFRLGSNRTIDSTSTETTGLMTLNFAPSAGLFK